MASFVDRMPHFRRDGDTEYGVHFPRCGWYGPVGGAVSFRQICQGLKRFRPGVEGPAGQRSFMKMVIPLTVVVVAAVPVFPATVGFCVSGQATLAQNQDYAGNPQHPNPAGVSR